MVHQKLGGYHSANLLIRSIDYHDLKIAYTSNWNYVQERVQSEIKWLENAGVDGIIICNNTLHKAWRAVRSDLKAKAKIFDAIDLTACELKRIQSKTALLLATPFTMSDGFFTDLLRSEGCRIAQPEKRYYEKIGEIQSKLSSGQSAIKEDREFFNALISQHSADTVVLACTELPSVVDGTVTELPIINPLELQCRAAIEFSTSVEDLPSQLT